MDDFAFPNVTNLYNITPSPANFMQPGKAPLSSMCPTIILNENGDVLFVIGAAGGSRITTTVAQVNGIFYVFVYEKLSARCSLFNCNEYCGENCTT